jgi:hypothetical protein
MLKNCSLSEVLRKESASWWRRRAVIHRHTHGRTDYSHRSTPRTRVTAQDKDWTVSKQHCCVTLRALHPDEVQDGMGWDGMASCRQPCKARTCAAFCWSCCFQVGHMSKLKWPKTRVFTQSHALYFCMQQSPVVAPCISETSCTFQCLCSNVGQTKVMRIDTKFLEILAFKAFKHEKIKKYIGICNSNNVKEFNRLNHKIGEKYSQAQQFIVQLYNCHRMLVFVRHVSTHFPVILRLCIT